MVVVAKGYLGDCIMSLPLIYGLQDMGHDVYIVSPNPAAALYVQAGLDKDHVFEIPKRMGAFPMSRVIRRLAPDAVILANRSFRSALAAAIARAKLRSGHSTEKRKWLLTHRFQYNQSQFEAECYWDLGGPVGLRGQCGMPVILKKYRPTILNSTEKKVLIQPGARYASKRAPTKVFADCAREFILKGFTVELVGGCEEQDAGKELEWMLAEMGIESTLVQNSIGETDLPGLMAKLSQARLVLGSDTGVLHIAVALGTPTATIFGPNPVAKWGHDYSPHIVIEAPRRDISSVTSEYVLDRLFEERGIFASSRNSVAALK